MKLLTLSLFVLLCASVCNAQQQQVYEPQILILVPAHVTYAPELQKEVASKESQLQALVQQKISQPIPAGTPANFVVMQKSTIKFLKKVTFAKQISFLSQDYLTYRFYERFPNCLLLLMDTVMESKTENLQNIAHSVNAAYVLNFPKVDFYKQNGQSQCKMKVQLYETQSNSLLVDKEYTGNFNNPGFEFTCEQGSIECTINNALSQALADVIKQVTLTNPTLKQAHALAQERAAYIESSIYHRPFDSSLIREAIPADSSRIELNNLYQCLYSDDRTKFVGFFIKTVAKDPKGLLASKEDKNVKVITSKDIRDTGYLNQSPQTYAYIVKGVKYDGKWYFEKSEVTYFDADNLEQGKLQYLNNLQEWDFFADDSATPGLKFWEGKLFKKITDMRKDPDWEQKKNVWAIEEHENRDYIGMYELVANKLKAIKSDENDDFRIKMLYGTLNPFYKDQAKHRANHIITVSDTTELFNLIYPKDRHVILNPKRIIDENNNTYIRFFVLLPQTKEIFEWTLVKPYLLKKDEYLDDPVVKTIGAFTIWDYTYQTLDDDKFWADKVLAKENGHYRYLIKLK